MGGRLPRLEHKSEVKVVVNRIRLRAAFSPPHSMRLDQTGITVRTWKCELKAGNAERLREAGCPPTRLSVSRLACGKPELRIAFRDIGLSCRMLWVLSSHFIELRHASHPSMPAFGFWRSTGEIAATMHSFVTITCQASSPVLRPWA